MRKNEAARLADAAANCRDVAKELAETAEHCRGLGFDPLRNHLLRHVRILEATAAGIDELSGGAP